MKKTIFGIITIIIIVAGAAFYLMASKPVSKKVYHVGVLNALDYFAPAIEGFKQKITQMGYVEGENIIYDIKKGPAPSGNKKILEKFVTDKVDLILSFPTEATIEAKEVTKNTGIPVIGMGIGIEGNNLVESLQKPGGNVTGVRFAIPEAAAKRLELLHTIAPLATRILIPYLKDYPTVAPGLGAVKPLAKILKVEILEVSVTSPDDLVAWFKAREASGDIGIDAILMIPEPTSIIPAFYNQIYSFAERHKIPVVSAKILDDDHGPVIGLIPKTSEFGELSAPIADKIFKGTSPGIIPIATANDFMEINYRVAQKLGLTIDEGLLSTADRVFH